MADFSRVGRKPIEIPPQVKVEIKEDGVVRVEGPKGVLEKKMPPMVKIVREGNLLKVEMEVPRKKLLNKAKAFQGLARALLNNMIIGTTEGFTKVLDIVGLGYKAELRGNDEIVFSLGYSHPVIFKLPQGISAKVEKGTGEVQARVIISGIDKELVGQVAADIRRLRPPDPYKGKGIRYADEVIVLKPGKSGKGGKGGKR